MIKNIKINKSIFGLVAIVPILNLEIVKSFSISLFGISFPGAYLFYLLIIFFWSVSNFKLIKFKTLNIFVVYELYLLFLLITDRKSVTSFIKETLVIILIFIFIQEINKNNFGLFTTKLYKKIFDISFILIVFLAAFQLVSLDYESMYSGVCYRLNGYMYHPLSLSMFFLISYSRYLRSQNIVGIVISTYYILFIQSRVIIVALFIFTVIYLFSRKNNIQKLIKIIFCISSSVLLLFITGFILKQDEHKLCGTSLYYLNLGFEQSITSFGRTDIYSVENFNKEKLRESEFVILDLENRITTFKYNNHAFELPFEFLNGRGYAWSVFLFEMSIRDYQSNIFGNAEWKNEYPLMQVLDAHNEVLRLIFDNGIVGLTLFSFIFFRLLNNTCVNKKQRIFLLLYCALLFSLNPYFIYIYSTVILMQLIYETRESLK